MTFSCNIFVYSHYRIILLKKSYRVYDYCQSHDLGGSECLWQTAAGASEIYIGGPTAAQQPVGTSRHCSYSQGVN